MSENKNLSMSSYIDVVKSGKRSWEDVVMFRAANVNAAMGIERMNIRLEQPQPSNKFRSVLME